MSLSSRRRDGGGSSSSSSFSAFAEVDSLVSKPVLGSDGAASWQQFRKEASGTGSARAVTTAAGPVLPVKRADRLGTGLQTRAEERLHEEAVRRDAGDAPLGSGYTHFKRRLDHDEIAAKKRAKLVADRVRPDDKRYFIASATFDAWKEDYVFTTRSRGTGYYWDGMDSAKKQLGILSNQEDGGEGVPDGSGGAQGAAAEDQSAKKVKKKKKKKKGAKSTDQEALEAVEDTNNPMEQIAAAIRRRQESLLRPPGSSSVAIQDASAEAASLTGSRAIAAAASGNNTDGAQQLAARGWETAVDPSSGKTYYFRRSTGERRWESPLPEEEKREEVADTPSGLIAALEAGKDGDPLPVGWKIAKVSSSGKEYYFHAASGKTQWTRPTEGAC